MKHLAKIFGTAAIVLSLGALISCNDLTGLVETEEESAGNRLTILVGGDNLSARTILPTDFEFTGLTFEISGTSSIGTSLIAQAIAITESSGTGSGTINLAPALWDLELVAKKTIGGTDVEVLKGKTTADLTNGATTISFNLKATGNGSSNVVFGNATTTVDFDTGDTNVKVSKYTIGLYDMKTGLPVNDTTGTTTVEDVTVTPAASTGTFDYSKSVAAGNYNLIVTFYNDATPEKAIGNYSETVVVVGGTDSVKGAYTVGNFLTAPTAPSAFKASFDSEVDANWYDVEFTWTDNSYNETEFILTILEEGVGPFAETDVYSDYVFDSSNLNRLVAGSLVANNQSATVRLPTGKKFKAMIASRNAAGKSSNVTALAFETGEFTDVIARTSVEFNLAGGTLAESAATTHAGYYYKQDYFSTTGISVPVLNAYDAASPVYPCAYNASSASSATQWTISGTGEQVADGGDWAVNASTITYKGLENVSLTLSYDTPVTVTIQNFQEIGTGCVTLAVAGTGSSYAAGVIELKKGESSTITVTFDKDDAETGNNNNFVKYGVCYGLTTGAFNDTPTSTKLPSDTFTINANTIPTDGILRIKVIAYNSDGYPFDIDTYVTLKHVN